MPTATLPSPQRSTTEAADKSWHAALQARASLLFFLTLVIIPDALRGAIRYEPWPHLVDLAQRLEARESLVILKARQLGVSWTIAAYALWVAQYRPGAVVILLSQGELEANALLDKARQIHSRLPAWAKAPLRTDNGGELAFIGGGSILALPSTAKAGRSWTATVVIADEAAFHPFAASNYAAYKPTLDGGGQLVMVSTSAGPHGLFYQLYTNARRALGNIRPLFLPWWSRPNRQQRDEDDRPNGSPNTAWLEGQKADFAGLQQQFKQEYPANEREAWTAIAGLVYGLGEDGELIFSPDDHPRGNLSPDPCAWEGCQWHFATVDWGGGDPTACDVWGMTSSGRIHQFSEGHWEGAAGINRIVEYLQEWEPKAGFDAILCGADDPTSIGTLVEQGFPTARAATTARQEGFQAASLMLRQRRITHNPLTCPHSIAEYDSYYWAVKTDPFSKEQFATRTPSNHHGDHKDGMRYLAVEVQQMEGTPWNSLPPVAVQVN